MAATALRREEAIGLALAVFGHAGLLALMLVNWPQHRPPVSERMTVSLSGEIGPSTTSPHPAPEAAPDKGPELGEAPPPPAPPAPLAPPRVEPRPAPAAPRAAPVKPQPAVKPAPARPAPPTQQKPPPGRPGASVFDQTFGKGIPQGKGVSPAAGNPAPFGPREQTALRASIGAEVRGPWNACTVSGLDVEKLRARVSFSLDINGALTAVGEPQVTGITPANSPQAKRFGECAVRAIRTAAPFNLPRELYDHWKSYTLNFEKRQM